jgi:serine/threonine protein kinase
VCSIYEDSLRQKIRGRRIRLDRRYGERRLFHETNRGRVPFIYNTHKTPVLCIVMIGKRFSIGPKLRQGAFGAIYQGTYEKGGEPVAIKMDLSRPSTLKHETRILQYLFMEGVKKVPHIYWFGIYEENPCVVMTLYECSLYDYRQRGPMGDSERLSKTAWLLLDIFEKIHKYGVLHRDVKPHNFMIKGGELYLIDFGLATFYWNDMGEHCPDTGTTTMIGSPFFASLRIHEGHRYSRRDDLISLGYVLLYMSGFTWELPNTREEGSPVDLDYPVNVLLRRQKEALASFPTPSLKYYFEYIYELGYEEAPKYGPMKTLFVSSTTQLF